MSEDARVHHLELAGIILDEEGRPLPGASVRACDARGRPLGERAADKEGRFRFALWEEGTHNLLVAAEGRPLACFGVIPDGTVRSFGLPSRPGPSGSLEGLVVDEATGSPLPGAIVRIMDQDDLVVDELRVRADGGFELRGLVPGHYKMAARCAGYAAGWTGAAVAAGTAAVEIGLARKAGGFAGRIRADGGEGPLKRASFTVYTRKGLAILTDFPGAGGDFSCEGLKPGEYAIRVDAPGFAPVVRSLFASTAAEEESPLEIALETRGLALGGRITAGDRPAAGAVARVFDGEGRQLGLAVADGEGRYLFPALPPGGLFLVASGPGLAAQAFPLMLSPENGDLPEAALRTDPCRLLKRFADFHGNPLADAEFRVVEASSGRHLFTVLTNREGFFWIRAWSSAEPAPPWTWL